jgi:cytochrome c oxidase subunit 1
VILGSALWGFFAAVYYWFPKLRGRFLDERLGWIHFWTVQVFFNATFAMFFWLGLEGLPRRVADYSAKFQLGMTLASIFAFCLGAAMLVFFANVVWSWFYGEKAAANPWRAKTLEWQTPTPVPIDNWTTIPIVTSWPYTYGRPEGQPQAPAGAPTPAGGVSAPD